MRGFWAFSRKRPWGERLAQAVFAAAGRRATAEHAVAATRRAEADGRRRRRGLLGQGGGFDQREDNDGTPRATHERRPALEMDRGSEEKKHEEG